MFKAFLGKDLFDQHHKDEAVGKPLNDLVGGGERDSPPTVQHHFVSSGL